MWRILRPFLTLGLLPLAQYIASRLRTSRDLDRATLIAKLADDVVGYLLVAFPGREWVAVVDEAIRILASAIPSVPTANVEVLRRAVIAALERKGVVVAVEDVENPAGP